MRFFYDVGEVYAMQRGSGIAGHPQALEQVPISEPTNASRKDLPAASVMRIQ